MEFVVKRCAEGEECGSFDCTCYTGMQKRQALIMQMCAYDATLAAAPAVIKCETTDSWTNAPPKRKPQQYGPILTRRRNARGTLRRSHVH